MKKFIAWASLSVLAVGGWTYLFVPSNDVRDILPQTAIAGETEMRTFHRMGIQMSKCDMLRIRIKGKPFYSIDEEPFRYHSMAESQEAARNWFKKLGCRDTQKTHIEDYP